jgi:YggT family protein
MNSYLAAPLDFVVRTLFELYILAVMLRFLLGLVRASFYNPLAQFLVKITNPPLRPLRRVIPGLFGVDLASVVLMVVLELAAVWLIALIWAAPFTWGGLLAAALVELVDLTFLVFLVAIFVQAILSWINPGSYNPVSSLLAGLTEPLLRPARRLIPPVSGFDLSPLVVLIALQVVRMLVMPLLRHLAALA